MSPIRKQRGLVLPRTEKFGIRVQVETVWLTQKPTTE